MAMARAGRSAWLDVPLRGEVAVVVGSPVTQTCCQSSEPMVVAVLGPGHIAVEDDDHHSAHRNRWVNGHALHLVSRVVISSVTPAIALIKKEAGPPTLITTGACSAIPSASFTSLTRRLSYGISVIVALKLRSWRRVADCVWQKNRRRRPHYPSARGNRTPGALRRVVGLHIIDRSVILPLTNPHRECRVAVRKVVGHMAVGFRLGDKTADV